VLIDRDDVRKLTYYRDLVLVLTQKEIKTRYKSSFLGYVWSVAHPLAFAVVYFIAFKVVMKIQMEDYALFLIAGLFPWQWFANSVNASPTSFLLNTSIIKKINFPRHIVIITMVLNDMVHFILSIPVIMFFMFLYKVPIHASWLYGVPLLLGIQFFLTYGLALMISSVNLFFRDLERLTSIFTNLLFYFTPIFYAETMIPEKFRNLLNLNPLSPLMISWRNLFLSGKLEVSSLGTSILFSVVFFLAGYSIYKKLAWKFAEVL
jgi:lipopolysaccharide transport system permease protein